MGDEKEMVTIGVLKHAAYAETENPYGAFQDLI